jgi:hypothetical protein
VSVGALWGRVGLGSAGLIDVLDAADVAAGTRVAVEVGASEELVLSTMAAGVAKLAVLDR